MVRKRTKSELTEAPTYDRRRFLSKVAFQLDLETCLEITEELERREWLQLNEMIKESNLYISYELYANALLVPWKNDIWRSHFHGKRIDYDSKIINNLLSLQAPVVCHVQRIKNQGNIGFNKIGVVYSWSTLAEAYYSVLAKGIVLKRI